MGASNREPYIITSVIWKCDTSMSLWIWGWGDPCGITICLPLHAQAFVCHRLLLVINFLKYLELIIIADPLEEESS